MLPFQLPNKQRSRYRSARAVRPQVGSGMKWNRNKIIFFIVAICLIGTLTILPVWVLESDSMHFGMMKQAHHHPTNLVLQSESVRKALIDHVVNNVKIMEENEKQGQEKKQVYDPVPDQKLPIEIDEEYSPLARGANHFPLSRTPALVGASRGHFECDKPVDEELMIYWNHPGTFDQEFTTPFASSEQGEKYISFEPDMGGWNNIRMSMETILVMAAAMGRTLVLPPREPLYLLGTGVENTRGFGDFFPLENPELAKHLKIISMEEFVRREGRKWLEPGDDEGFEHLLKVSKMCTHQMKSDINCDLLAVHLRKEGLQPKIMPQDNCFVFDSNALAGKKLHDDVQLKVDRFCGGERRPMFYDTELREATWIHWDASSHDWRLLQHFYTFLFFTDPVVDNFYKRFVRDFLHYRDQVYCAAWKVVDAVQKEADAAGVPWSALHVRRGDFQYKQMKLPANEWYENTKEVWQPGEILFIATDERDKSFFDAIKDHQPVRFLDDYWELASLGSLDKSYLGMVDTIIASHGRAFAGTWFSTFTGYINRMRGYLGKPMKNSWYGHPDRKDRMQEYEYPNGNYPAREWPLGWVGIDTNEIIEQEQPVAEASTFGGKVQENPSKSVDRKIPKLVADDLTPDVGFAEKPVARGVAGLPMQQTPAVVGASRGHIECDVNVDALAYWNDPQGEQDAEFKSPFKVEGEKYISFATDRGGWNNLRMAMEIMFVIAAVTGRTLVLPPKKPMYLLNKDKEDRHRGFADFMKLNTESFQKRVKVITMEEFIRKEGGEAGRFPVPDDKRKLVSQTAKHCVKMYKNDESCHHIFDFLVEVGHVPDIAGMENCVVFDFNIYQGREIDQETSDAVENRCGERKITYWTSEEMDDPILLHFRGGEKEWRLLAHFYNLLFFTDPTLDHYVKRFVRDFLHYHDAIYCAAGKIVKALQVEGEQRGFLVDDEGAGGYSAMHIRRGDFQFKKVKISATEWYENTKEVWKPGEIMYIATDEKNLTSLDAIGRHHELRYLSDYTELAGLDSMDPNYMGMIDTIVASRARAFAGTYFSTFTGYINRMRGYHGMTMNNSWYSFLDKKDFLHEWEEVSKYTYAFEWPDGWIGIDADEWPSKDRF